MCQGRSLQAAQFYAVSKRPPWMLHFCHHYSKAQEKAYHGAMEIFTKQLMEQCQELQSTVQKGGGRVKTPAEPSDPPT